MAFDFGVAQPGVIANSPAGEQAFAVVDALLPAAPADHLVDQAQQLAGLGRQFIKTGAQHLADQTAGADIFDDPLSCEVMVGTFGSAFSAVLIFCY